MLKSLYGADALEARRQSLAAAQEEYRLRGEAPLPTRLYQCVEIDTLEHAARLKRKSNGATFRVQFDVALGIDVGSRVACAWAAKLGAGRRPSVRSAPARHAGIAIRAARP